MSSSPDPEWCREQVAKWTDWYRRPPAITTFKIRSSSGTSEYEVTVSAEGHWTCPCRGFKYRRQCRHITEAKEAHDASHLP